MFFLREDADVFCEHDGQVSLAASQYWVSIEERMVLVERDPEGRSFAKACPNTNPLMGIKPCMTTLPVQAGYSVFLRVDGKRLCLDTVEGITDGTPPGNVYHVRNAGQQ